LSYCGKEGGGAQTGNGQKETRSTKIEAARKGGEKTRPLSKKQGNSHPSERK